MTIFSELMPLVMFLGLLFNTVSRFYAYGQYRKKKERIPSIKYIDSDLFTWERFLVLIIGEKTKANQFRVMLIAGNLYMLYYLLFHPASFNEVEANPLSLMMFGMSIASLILTGMLSVEIMIESKRRLPVLMFFTPEELESALPSDFFEGISIESFNYADVTDMSCLDVVLKFKGHPHKNKHIYAYKVMSLFTIVPEEYYDERDVLEKGKKAKVVINTVADRNLKRKDNVIFAEKLFLNRRGS